MRDRKDGSATARVSAGHVYGIIPVNNPSGRAC